MDLLGIGLLVAVFALIAVAMVFGDEEAEEADVDHGLHEDSDSLLEEMGEEIAEEAGKPTSRTTRNSMKKRTNSTRRTRNFSKKRKGSSKRTRASKRRKNSSRKRKNFSGQSNTSSTRTAARCSYCSGVL